MPGDKDKENDSSDLPDKKPVFERSKPIRRGPPKDRNSDLTDPEPKDKRGPGLR